MLFAKVGIKSCRGARECVSFVHVCMYVVTQLLSKHMQYAEVGMYVCPRPLAIKNHSREMKPE